MALFRSLTYICILLLGLQPLQAQTLKALFDNTKNETAGNADWIIDTHQPVPSPAQSGITQSTLENYWLGGISAWGIDLVKLGFTVHTLTTAYGITYGNSSNPYDLSNYNIFIVCEPQGPFSIAEKSAIKSFVQNGGGLMMVADHSGSDRNSDGWDSPMVWNDLRSDTLFGIHFQSTGETNNSISQDPTNIASSSADSIIFGPVGTATTISYHAGTTMNLLPAANPSARGHIWMNGAPQGNTQVMAATAWYGKGKVAGVGDSSPADDGTAQPGNSSIYNGWTGDSPSDRIVFLNMCLWLAATAPVAPLPPSQVALISPVDGSLNIAVPAVFQWDKSQGATGYQFELSISNTFSTILFTDSTLTDSFKVISSLGMNTTYYWRVRAKNEGGWGSYSSIWGVTTWNIPSAVQLELPGNNSLFTPTPVTCTWHPTPTATKYEFDLSLSDTFGLFLLSDSTKTDTALTVPGLSNNTNYFWRVRAANDAGWGPFSTTRQFTTWGAPPAVQLVSPPTSISGLVPPIAFRWRGAPMASFYQIEFSNSALFDTIFMSDSVAADTSITFTGFDSTTVYYWRARAGNELGWGAYSSPWSFSLHAPTTIAVIARSGWNMLSLPIRPADPRKTLLIPSSISQAFTFNQGYVPRDSLQFGDGYWVKFASPETLSYTGEAVLSDTVQVEAGWNLIGSLSFASGSNQIISIPPAIIASQFFCFDGSYTASDSLLPGFGYWVKVSRDGALVLQQSAAATQRTEMKSASYEKKNIPSSRGTRR